jgi:hypothetical protein
LLALSIWDGAGDDDSLPSLARQQMKRDLTLPVLNLNWISRVVCRVWVSRSDAVDYETCDYGVDYVLSQLIDEFAGKIKRANWTGGIVRAEETVDVNQCACTLPLFDQFNFNAGRWYSARVLEFCMRVEERVGNMQRKYRLGCAPGNPARNHDGWYRGQKRKKRDKIACQGQQDRIVCVIVWRKHIRSHQFLPL